MAVSAVVANWANDPARHVSGNVSKDLATGKDLLPATSGS